MKEKEDEQQFEKLGIDLKKFVLLHQMGVLIQSIDLLNEQELDIVNKNISNIFKEITKLINGGVQK